MVNHAFFVAHIKNCIDFIGICACITHVLLQRKLDMLTKYSPKSRVICCILVIRNQIISARMENAFAKDSFGHKIPETQSVAEITSIGDLTVVVLTSCRLVCTVGFVVHQSLYAPREIQVL